MPTPARKTRPRGSWAPQNTFDMMEVRMTGIERLRELAGGIRQHSVWSVTREEYDNAHGLDAEHKGGQLCDLLADIAYQIEREQRRDPAADVSVSAYDLLPEEERDAIAWVRDHGGLDHVRSEWRSRVPYDRYERRRQSLLGHISECDTALGRRRRRIEELECRVKALTNERDELRPRLMPEGYEWPMFEDGEPVRIGDAFAYGDETFYVDSVQLLRREFHLWATNGRVVTGSNGERCERPAPKVLDADGVEVEVGDDLYSVEGMLKFHVSAIDKKSGRIATEAMFALDKWADPKMYTHRTPVLAADGRPLRDGETVWRVDTGVEYWVKSGQTITADAVVIIRKTDCDCESEIVKASQLTHTKPEPPDSWERWREEWQWPPVKYCKLILGVEYDHDTQLNEAFDAQGDDLVRRARALAERDAK